MNILFCNAYQKIETKIFIFFKAILMIYMTKKLIFDEKSATLYFHTFAMMVYLSCVVGALISDAWLGKFKTIFYLSIVYCVGSVVMLVGSIPHLNIPSVEFLNIALLLIAIVNSAMRPCVSAFAGDQFKMPEQSAYMATFFSLFFTSINVGTLISTTVTPVLRRHYDAGIEGNLHFHLLIFCKRFHLIKRNFTKITKKNASF